jgi:hypothetical protein
LVIEGSLSEEPQTRLSSWAHGKIKAKEFTMDRADTRATNDKGKGVVKDTVRKQAEVKFDKPLGSSRNDEADLRDVARKAAKKSR